MNIGIFLSISGERFYNHIVSNITFKYYEDYFRIEMIKLDPPLYKQKTDRFLKFVQLNISYFAIFDSHSEDVN